MSRIATPLLARAKLSVPVNGIWVPLERIVEAVQRFCPPAFFHHEGTPFELSSPGSSLLLRYRGRNLALCTRHQLGDRDATEAGQFTILIEGNKIGLSPNLALHRVEFRDLEHRNLEDVFLAEYEDQRDGRNLRQFFMALDLETTLADVDSASVKVIFAIGYPSASRDINFDTDQEGLPENISSKFGWVKLYLVPDEAALLDLENRRPMVQDPRANQETIDPDGMSGAPVFFVWLDNNLQANLGLAGTITDARRGRYMIYDTIDLRRIIDGYISQPPTRVDTR